MTSGPISLGGSNPLACSVISEIATGIVDIKLDPVGLARAARGRALADDLAGRRPIYGRGTGVGANRTVEVLDRSAAALALIRSHATSAGPLRSAERVRAMLAIRIHQLGQGGSGVTPAVVEALTAMLRADALPPVREYGSIGTGDLSALATTAAALLGEVPTSAPLPVTVAMDANDALAFISSNAATLADAALAVADLQRLSRAALGVATLSFAALRGNPEAFSAPVEAATPFPGAARVCRIMRASVDGGGPPARIQDPYGLRALPQVHGLALDCLDALSVVVTALAGASSENPVFAQPDSVAHHAAFHMAYLSTALDTARSGLAQSGQLIQARLAALVDPALTGLPAFLGDGSPGASGVMITEYVAASGLAALRSAATPTAVQGISVSRGVEEDASFASLGARQALDSVQPYRTMLACELVVAVRAVRLGTGPAAGARADSARAAGARTDGARAEGARTDGARAEGAPTDSAPTDSAPTDSAPTDSAPTDSAPTDSARTDSARADGRFPRGLAAELLDLCGDLPAEVADRDLTADIALADTLLDRIADRMRDRDTPQGS